ncbi:urease accessory protein UreH domain-containing protein [Priestia abyssalis]|uniref:urease accessory protein UreH domain-containing protein n=1 Tax=Priestia abyssalis TaxID=1221450 RepID=UPI000994F460|nr:sulfite exporter TauE/SafE family protein [Priestia abyssalis]
MEFSLLSVLVLGLVLGIKHAIEPDHIIAVSTIASQSQKLSRASLAGVFWGIGHTMTLFIVGMVLIILKNEIPASWAMSLEFLVGIMLVYLGLSTFFALKHSADQHQHAHHSYIKSMAIGFIHGLAGSAAMVLLTMSTVEHTWQGAVYIAIFGIGTCIGMLAFTTILGIPFVRTKNKLTLNRSLTRFTGFVSMLFGLYYMYNLGVNEGLFSIWFR